MLGNTPVVDVHHHFLPRPVFDRLKAQAGGARRLVNERISITLTDELHDPATHLATMDQGGVDTAILTYSGVSILGPEICRLLNDSLAEVQAQHQRWFGTAHANLNDPGAGAELQRAVGSLGLRAVALPTSDPGIALDDRRLDPMWAVIDQMDVPVILHPILLPQGASTDYGLERSCARPFDTTNAAVRLAYGVIPRFPRLRFVLPHLGGTTIFLRGRLAMFFQPPDVPPEQARSAANRTQRELRAQGMDRVFDRLWGSFFYDTAGTGAWAPALEMTARVVGPARMLFGSDYPLESHSGETVRELVEMVEGLPLSQPEREQIAGTNAKELFRLH